TNNQQPTTNNQQPTTNNQQPTTNNQQPTTNNQQPTHNNLTLDRSEIRKAILKSQHCQRNFDLSQTFPEEDIELLKTAISQCPSKQNIAFYKAHFIFDREIIEKLHNETKGFTIKTTENEPLKSQTNSQILANLVVVFEEIEPSRKDSKFYTNEQLERKAQNNASQADLQTLKKDKQLAVGVAAGYLNLTATLLGYSTGCCSCFSGANIRKILHLENQVLLMMGIGFKDINRNRREHHLDKNFIFPSKRKQPIEVNIIGDWKKTGYPITKTASNL
ncbi:MAG: nitroreductase family protein, partial [Bdellovibrionales bacterium]|nr:nitroreductase family protein [Bdellovibrionales bacterium]